MERILKNHYLIHVTALMNINMFQILKLCENRKWVENKDLTDTHKHHCKLKESMKKKKLVNLSLTCLVCLTLLEWKFLKIQLVNSGEINFSV